MEELLQKLGSENMDNAKEGIMNLKEWKGTGISHITETLYNLLWSTPGFKQQVNLVDLIIEHSGEEVHKSLLAFILDKFGRIITDRRDKFYYFIEKSLGLLSFKEMLEVSDSDVLEHLCRCLNKSKPSDWNDDVFLKFIATCKPWLCGMFPDVRIDEEVVRPYLSQEMGQANRVAMYGFFGKC